MDPLAIVLVVVALGIAGWLGQRQRNKMDEYRKRLEAGGEYVAPEPRKLTRAQRRIEEFRASVPQPPLASIEDIARAEAEDLGLLDLPGAEGLPINVLLLVWRRDEAVRARCDGGLGYELTTGVDPAAATEDDVRLTCDRPLRTQEDESGNNAAG